MGHVLRKMPEQCTQGPCGGRLVTLGQRSGDQTGSCRFSGASRCFVRRLTEEKHDTKMNRGSCGFCTGTCPAGRSRPEATAGLSAHTHARLPRGIRRSPARTSARSQARGPKHPDRTPCFFSHAQVTTPSTHVSRGGRASIFHIKPFCYDREP